MYRGNLFPICFHSNALLWLPWCTDKRLWNAWRSSTPGGNSRCVSWSRTHARSILTLHTQRLYFLSLLTGGHPHHHACVTELLWYDADGFDWQMCVFWLVCSVYVLPVLQGIVCVSFRSPLHLDVRCCLSCVHIKVTHGQDFYTGFS